MINEPIRRFALGGLQNCICTKVRNPTFSYRNKCRVSRPPPAGTITSEHNTREEDCDTAF